METIFNHQLLVRVISALSMLPIAVFAIWFGGVWFDALLVLAILLMSVEWCHITNIVGRSKMAYLMLSVGMAAYLVLYGSISFNIESVAAILMFSILAGLYGVFFDRKSAAWCATGLIYFGIAIYSFHWLRGVEDGVWWTAWTFLMVWAMDVGGFFAGKGIGGPKLAPRLSPKKTWAGLAGGMALAIVASFVFQLVINEFPDTMTQTFYVEWYFAAVLAGVAQVGDLAESAVKRHFNVKDAGGIIPGHGGLLDRADGLLIAGPVVLLWLEVSAP